MVAPRLLISIMQMQPSMNPTINAYPNPFLSSITVEVISEQDQHNILRLTDKEGRFIKVLSWRLQKGTNIAALNNLGKIGTGTYTLDIIDQNANILHKTRLEKK